MRFTVGGESFDLTKEQVTAAVKDAQIETIHKHVVEIEGEVFPPKQVFAAVTGRRRQSFTTMEAQRVLTRLGFVCRRAGNLDDGTPAWLVDEGGERVNDGSSHEKRLAHLESVVGTMQAAVAGLHGRLCELEKSA